MEKNKKKQFRGFTLIESMIVLFIIGLLSFIAAIGYGKANRQKILDQSLEKISTETSRVRDYSIFGQEISGIYPCGYGVVIGRNKNEIKDVYISGEGTDRVSAMESNKTCDEIINNQERKISEIPADDKNGLSLKKTSITRIDKIKNAVMSDTDLGCAVMLFSAPHGIAYYCFSSDSSCPPDKCTFQIFSEKANLNSDFFLATLSVREGPNSNLGYLTIYPSGNSEITQQ